MAIPSYHPITRHDRLYGVLVMAAAAAHCTVAAWGMVKNDSHHNVEIGWLVIAFAFLLFFAGLLWLVMNYRYTGRPWSRLVTQGSSCSGGVFGLTIILSNAETLLPIAFGMWAWTAAVAVVLYMDRGNESTVGSYEELDVPEYAIGTPHDPRAPLQSNQQSQRK